MEKEYVVYQSKSKQIGLSLMGLLMVLVSLVLLLVGVTESEYWILGIGIIGFLFFGACEIYIIKQVFLGKKLVVLSSLGFNDYSSALATKDKVILWNDVKKIENTGMLNQSFVSVYLKNPEEFLSDLSSFQRKAIAANVKMGFGEINITLQSAKKCTNAQLIEMMHSFIDSSGNNSL